MHSFGLEECNHYAEAEKVARKVIIYISLYALYTGKINIFALVVSERIQDLANSKVSYYLSLNTTVSGRIQFGAKLLSSVEGRKLHWAKISLFTVFFFFIRIWGNRNDIYVYV